MIKFVQDYTTKSLPPESFEVDQEVERSAESEAYFVRLGVAGFLVDGVVVDEDYRPIVRTPIAVVVTTDRRFVDTGRGGEVIGLDTPQRASSGPGNAVVFAGQPDSVGLDNVEVEQLRSDIANALAGQQAAAGRIEGLTGNLLALETERDRLTLDLTAAQNALDDATRTASDEVSDLRSRNDELVSEMTSVRSELDAAQARVTELEAQLADLAKADAQDASAGEDAATAAPASASTKRSK